MLTLFASACAVHFAISQSQDYSAFRIVTSVACCLQTQLVRETGRIRTSMAVSYPNRMNTMRRTVSSNKAHSRWIATQWVLICCLVDLSGMNASLVRAVLVCVRIAIRAVLRIAGGAARGEVGAGGVAGPHAGP